MERGEYKIKKVRFTVPYFIKEKIKEDEKHFSLLTGEIGNKLFSYYSNKDIENLNINSAKGEIIQFNLNKLNDELYYIVLKEHEVQNEAEFFRNIFFKYLDNPRYIREQILFFEIFEKIESALKERKKINIKYNGEIRTINPYLLKTSSIEDRSYIFSYCEKNEDYRNYRIANIENISLSKYDIEVKNLEYIKSIDKNFDPFLSFGKNIKIKINENGQKLFESVILNRPKVLEKNGDIWILECTNKLAKVYFPQFLSNIEVLEPVDLREWFQKELKKALDIYL
ncbi:MAG: WYL domain-containing protein [Cetobacterium sp.]|uniref:WYL domain-containing protein n=1 Tax=Cetobacterium sp. TaxID=2071632 RepID=UPI002FC792EB